MERSLALECLLLYCSTFILSYTSSIRCL